MIHQSPSSHVRQAAPVDALFILSFAKRSECIDFINFAAFMGIINDTLQVLLQSNACSVYLVAFTMMFVNCHFDDLGNEGDNDNRTR